MGSKKLNKEIVLNLMYNGRYLKDDNNIGYEIINLYKSDSDENYIYLFSVELDIYSYFKSENDFSSCTTIPSALKYFPKSSTASLSS